VSVVTVGKNGRVYQRRFDHDEARARHAAGETYRALAHAYGVSTTAVERVCDDKVRAQMNDRVMARIYSGVCEGCGKGVTSAEHRRHKRVAGDKRVLCIRCRGIAKRTRLRYDKDGVLVEVCCSSLDCANGERWQTPDSFPGGVKLRDVRPKGIHTFCRACNTRQRRAYRHAHREQETAANRAYRARRKVAA
jgi:hypothetical protein